MNEENMNEIKELLKEVKLLLQVSNRDFPKFVNTVDNDALSMKNSADYLKNSVNTFNNYMNKNIIDIEIRNYLDILNNPELMNSLNINEDLLISKISNLLDRKGIIYNFNFELSNNVQIKEHNEQNTSKIDYNKIIIKKNRID